MTLNEAAIADLRPEFPALRQRSNGRPLVFMDGPGGTQVHGSVIEAMNQYMTQATSNVHGAFLFSQRTDEIVDQGRRALADLLNAARPEEIVFGGCKATNSAPGVGTNNQAATATSCQEAFGGCNDCTSLGS